MAKLLNEADLVDARQVSAVLRCSICTDIFESPVVGPCQHAFCQSCLSSAFSQSSKEAAPCPQCRAPLHAGELRPHLVLRSLLDELPVRCARRCGWTGRLDARARHDEVCPVKHCTELHAQVAQLQATVVLRESQLHTLREDFEWFKTHVSNQLAAMGSKGVPYPGMMGKLGCKGGLLAGQGGPGAEPWCAGKGGTPLPGSSSPNVNQPLDTCSLALAPPWVQKRVISERLHPLLRAKYESQLSTEICCSLLHMDNQELLALLNSEEQLRAKIL